MVKEVRCAYCRIKLRVDDSKDFRCAKCKKVNNYIEFEEGKIGVDSKPIHGYLGRGYKLRVIYRDLRNRG